MNENQRAAFVVAQAAMLNAEVAGMQAENMARVHLGQAMAYQEDAFRDVVNKYQGTIGHNQAITFLMGE